MICITGAGGTVGSEVVRQLQAAEQPFRAVFHSQKKADAARERGIEAVAADYARPDTLGAAFAGCQKLFLVGPVDPNSAELELNAVRAAKEAGVRHVVKLSVWGAAEEEFAFARAHRPVERAIESSGMAWTFIRPNGFMQNFVTYMGEGIRGQGAFYSAVGEVKMSHVDIRDIAAVAVRALTEPGHEGKAYTLSGPEALTYSEMAALLSQATGRQINHVSLPPADLKGGMLAAGVPEPLAEMLLDLEKYYGAGKASGLTGDVRRVTGHDPRRFADTARDLAPALQPG